MKPLPVEFDRKGWHFKQLKREGMIAIYLRTKPGITSQIESYEVIKIRRHNGYVVAGNRIEAAETYPSSCHWGEHGWTYRSFEEALVRFNSLVLETSKPKPAVFICGEGDDSGNETKRLVA